MLAYWIVAVFGRGNSLQEKNIQLFSMKLLVKKHNDCSSRVLCSCGKIKRVFDKRKSGYLEDYGI